jgi:peptidoglycan/LPS O-acetylase OafA/YrhL
VSAVFIAYLVVFVGPRRPFYWYGGLTLATIATAFILYAVLETDWRGKVGLHFRPLVVLGSVSYGLYLWHLPIYVAVARHAYDWPLVVKYAVAFAGSAVMTVISWRFIERPALSLKKRLEPRTTREARTGPADTTPEPAPAAAT